MGDEGKIFTILENNVAPPASKGLLFALKLVDDGRKGMRDGSDKMAPIFFKTLAHPLNICNFNVKPRSHSFTKIYMFSAVYKMSLTDNII